MFAASSLIFVPGSRPDRFAKARASRADMVIIDLEDAVAAADKDEARTSALAALADHSMAVRINPVTTRTGLRDLVALGDAATAPAAILLPMVEDAAQIEVVRGALGEGHPPLIPLVETPRGLAAAPEIAAASGVEAMMLGGADMAAELGVELAWEPLAHVRGAFVLACARAHVPAIDVPWIKLDDAAGLAEECRRARAMGFAAKAAIHPTQIAAIAEAFRPDAAQIAEAREALSAYEAGGCRAVRHNGRMLEAPLVKHYQAVLARGENQHA